MSFYQESKIILRSYQKISSWSHWFELGQVAMPNHRGFWERCYSAFPASTVPVRFAADSVHHSAPLPSRLSWATGPDMPLFRTHLTLCLTRRELLAVQVWKRRYRERTGLPLGLMGRDWHSQD